MSDTYAPAMVSVAPVLDEPELPVPQPSAPWIVDEDREPWPKSVANGTWDEMYPDHPEGPERVVLPAHYRDNQHLVRGIRAHLEMERRLTGRDFLIGSDNILQDGNERMHPKRPDLFVYRTRPEGYDIQDTMRYVDVRTMGPPHLVMEVLSRGTWRNDVGAADLPHDENKMSYYAEMGVREYWIVNPHPEKIIPQPRLQGFKLNRAVGTYETIKPDAQGMWCSDVLETAWGVDAENCVRLWNPLRRAWYPIEGTYVDRHEAEDVVVDLEHRNQELVDANADLKQQIAQHQEQRIDDLLQFAAYVGAFTPSQLEAYRTDFQVLAADHIPTVVDFLDHLNRKPDQSPHDVVKAFLDNAGGR